MDKQTIEAAMLSMVGYHVENPDTIDLNETLWETLGRAPTDDESKFAYGALWRMRLVIDPEED